MINEEVSDKTLNLEIKAAKITAELIVQQIKKLLKEAKKFGGMEKFVSEKGNEVKLKDLVQKGQLEEITIKETELKRLKKELNKYGVNKKVLADLEKKTERKESIHKNLEKFKELVKNTIFKDKIKNKQKEQSL
nr:DUF3801 domain-containing protein [uncultured Oribacterium sp.]